MKAGGAPPDGDGVIALPRQAAWAAFGDQAYRVLVLAVFLAQVFAARHIPIVGEPPARICHLTYV